MYSLLKATKSLSDNTRLRIINLLLERECCVCEVMQVLQISQTRASRNLTMLFDAGFLKLKKEGLWSLYSIDKQGMPDYLNCLVESVKLALVKDPVAVQDRARLEKAVRIGPGCVQKGNGNCSTRSDEVVSSLSREKQQSVR
jgi:ArsR family transcriptional regulator, arsenate/arsenite/antimonite-responsive transcriptional repressor